VHKQPPPPPPPSAGGLTAPGPVDPSAQQPGPTENDLDEAKEDDSERGLSWFYVEVEGGFQHIGLETFEVEEEQLTAGFVESEASGGYVGLGLGVHLVVVQLGPRLRLGFFPDYRVFSVGGEFGLRIPISFVEPTLTIGAGYTGLGTFTDLSFDDDISIEGFDVRIAGGLDFFVHDNVSLGAGASWEFIGLTRPGVDVSKLSEAEKDEQNIDQAREDALAAEGSAYGSIISITARLGLHF